MTLTLNISVQDEEMNDAKTIARLISALTALAPDSGETVETDENGLKTIPTDDEPEAPAAPSPDDQIAKAIEESEKRRETRTKKTEKKAEKDAPTATETEVRMALGKLQRTDGGKDKVRAILNKLGAKNFPELDPAKYSEALALTVKELKAIEEEDE